MSRQSLGFLSFGSMLFLRASMRKVCKVSLYFIGIVLFELGLFGVVSDATSFDNTLHNQLLAITFFLGILILIIYTYYFFCWHFHIAPLRLRQYFLWLIVATLTELIPIVFATSFVPDTNANYLLTQILVGLIVSFYGVLMLLIAHMKPSLRQQVDESVQKILEIAPSKQISLTELIEILQHKYKCSNLLLYQFVNNLIYVEQVDIPGTDIKACRIKGKELTLAFPQILGISDPNIRKNLERTLIDLTEERVDIGLFLLGREFETTLKAFLIKAYAKGKLITTPGGKHPDQLKLVEMIACLRSNGIVVDDAALSYLRQTRNDRAHGATPTLAERRLLMNNVQLLAGLYIDYIKFFDDLIRNLN